MITKDYIILAPEGIHARPATMLVKLTKKFKSVISLQKDNKVIRLNSMLNILSMGAKGGDTITVMVEGEDETEAAQAIDSFFKGELKDI